MLSRKLLKILADLFFIGILFGLSYFLVSFYTNSNYIITGYYDWFMHAFRIKTLQEYGLSSWLHTWANGINIWQSYQLLPHYITLLVADFFHVSITKAMILITMAIFILIRLLLYVILRLAKFRPFVAFTCAVLSFTTQMYWISMSDYSLQFGVLFILFYIFLWQFYLKGKLSLVFPFLVGLTFFINPVLTFYCGLLWVFGIIFSEKRILSWKMFLEIVVFLIGASWFLYPWIFKSSYLYSNPLFESLSFLSSFTTKMSWLGFSLSLIVLIPFVFVNLFTKYNEQENWLRALGIYTLICFILVIIGTIIQLPYVLSAFQFTRGVPIIALALCIAGAPIINKITKKTLLQFVVIFGLVFSFAESMWVNKVYAPYPVTHIYDPLTTYLIKHPEKKNDRFFSPLIDITSYVAPTTIHLPYSYMEHLDANQVSPRIVGLVNSYPGNDEANPASITRLNNYFKVAGTQYILFNQTSPFAKAYLDSELGLHFANIGKVELPDDIYYVFKVPWNPRNAEVIDPSLTKQLDHFPFTITFSNNNDYITLDNYVQNFANTIYNPKNQILSISYPTQESMIVQVPPNRKSNVIYIDESYSKDWKAVLSGVEETVKPVGPNYMAVFLDNSAASGQLVLTHSWSRNMILIAWVILATPFGIGIYNLIALLIKKRTHTITL